MAINPGDKEILLREEVKFVLYGPYEEEVIRQGLILSTGKIIFTNSVSGKLFALFAKQLGATKSFTLRMKVVYTPIEESYKEQNLNNGNH